MTTKDAKSVGLIVPHTHWDREWRYPLWKSRAHLVALMKGLLTILEQDASYRCFVTDGQVGMVDDFLEFCPEDEPRVRALVTADRLKIGPWYTLPDLYPLDGECLLRNLLKGLRRCRDLGGHLSVGYNSFGWGQTAQFPQIYRGFGFDFVVAAKRVSEQRAPHCEYWWEAPDGTRVLATRLGVEGRANGFFHLYIPIRFGMDYMSPEYRFTWGATCQVLKKAGADEAHEDYFRVDSEYGYHKDKVRDAFAAAWSAMDASLVPDVRLILSGSDFTAPQPALPRMIADGNAAFTDRTFRMGTLEEYADLLHERLEGRDDVPVVKGELRDGPASGCSGNALAVRIHLKQLNKQVENALMRRAEPMAALLSAAGFPYPRASLDRAWHYLLLTHSHDSINGVTQDKTADDNQYRLNQALELADVAFGETVTGLAQRIDCSGFAPDEVLLLVVNPHPRPVRDILKACVDMPIDRNAWDVDIANAGGDVLATQFVGRRQMTCPVVDPEARPWPFDYDRHTLYVDAGELPAGGYTLLRATPRTTFDRNAEWWPTTRTTPGEHIARDAQTLENEFLRVDIQPDGTIDLTDKATGRTTPDIHYFEDTGDVGDYWVYYPPHQNKTLVSRGVPARIWLEDNGPLSATIAVELRLRVPARAVVPEKTVMGESARVEESVEVPIVSRFTLQRGKRRLEVKTEVENTAEDHRLRLMLPTDLEASFTDSAGHFNVDRRPNIPTRDDRGEYWPEMQTVPMQVFVDVSDDRQGLAVVSDSFTECQLLDDTRRTLALTLFRAVRNRLCTEYRSTGNFPNQKGGQLLRTLTFSYAIYPHSGDWEQGEVYEEALTFNTPPAVFQISPGTGRDLPPEASLFRIEPSTLISSALKKAEDRDTLILRVFNPTRQPVDGRIRFFHPPSAVWPTNLDEVREEPLRVNEDDAITVRVEPGRILTLEIANNL